MKNIIEDLLACAGMACVTIGAFMVHTAAGFIVGGLLLIGCAYLWARGGDTS